MDIDNHPIPQDVSHFQFKLIGDLTVKQFGYLIGSAILTWMLFSLPLFWFLKFPFMLVTAGAGVILCFVPLEGRPADIMAKNFLKALLSPNEFVFDKHGAHVAMEKAPISAVSMTGRDASTSVPTAEAAPVTTQPGVQAATPEVITNAPEQPIQQSGAATPPPEAPQGPTAPKPRVRILNQEESLAAGFPNIPDVPNIVLGIVKDSRANAIPNVLIEVKNTQGNPVRAFKTNTLGQFASATPLQNGTYTIYLEDTVGTHTFDTVVIEAKGQVLLPIEIISIDNREELRKQLFG